MKHTISNHAANPELGSSNLFPFVVRPIIVGLANFFHLTFGQLGIGAVRSRQFFGKYQTAGGNHVSHIFLLCACIQMVRIATMSVVASVANVSTLWNGSVVQSVSCPVCCDGERKQRSNSDDWIMIPVWPFPFPTTQLVRGDLDFTPKPDGRGFSHFGYQSFGTIDVSSTKFLQSHSRTVAQVSPTVNSGKSRTS